MVKFFIQSTYNVLPCPTNLKLWNLLEDDRCVWCHERGTAEHILNGCAIPLAGGMYKWRHDQVLLDIGSTTRHAVKQANDALTPAPCMMLINFVKETDPVLVSTVKPGRGILTAANDW